MIEPIGLVPAVHIGERIRVEKDSNSALWDLYRPQIEVNGRFHYIADKYNSTGFVECHTRRAAKRIAKQTRDESIRKLLKMRVGEETDNA